MTSPLWSAANVYTTAMPTLPVSKVEIHARGCCCCRHPDDAGLGCKSSGVKWVFTTSLGAGTKEDGDSRISVEIAGHWERAWKRLAGEAREPGQTDAPMQSTHHIPVRNPASGIISSGRVSKSLHGRTSAFSCRLSDGFLRTVRLRRTTPRFEF